MAKVYVDSSGYRHYWQGEDPDPEDVGFSVYNLEESVSPIPDYRFSGSVGEVGIACLDESDPDATKYRIVFIGTPDNAIIVELNAQPVQWANDEEYTPGCTTASGVVVEACGSTEYMMGETVDVVFPRVRGRLIAVDGGDRVSAVLLNDKTAPKRFIAASDYTKSTSEKVYWGHVNEDVLEWASGSNCTTVTVLRVDSCGGIAGDLPVSVLLPKLQPPLKPYLHAGDRIAYVYTSNIAGDGFSGYVCVSDYTNSGGHVRWGFATETVTEWQTGGGCTMVAVDTQDNCHSDGEDSGGATLFVVLPKIQGKRPNIHNGDVIAFTRAHDIDLDPNQYVCVSDYAVPLGPSVVAELTNIPAQWSNNENYEPGCQTATGTIINACGSSDYLLGDTITIVFPNVRDKKVVIQSGDYVTAVLMDGTVTPPVFAAASDYTGYGFECGLKFEVGNVSFAASDVAGKGLTVDTGEEDDECKLQVDPGCGLKFTGNKVAVDNLPLAGLGLFADINSCSVNVATGCGLIVEPTLNKVQVLPSDLAGGGLMVGAGCQLQVNAGCGITLTGGAVTVNSMMLAGPGLVEAGICGLAVNVGCGLMISGDAVVVDASDMAGKGLVEFGECALMVDLGCGLKFDGNDKVSVDNIALAGEGLVPDDAGCALKVSYGCGLTINDNVLEVSASDLAGDGLATGSGCELKVDVGCGLRIESGKVRTDVDGSPDAEVEYVSKVECVEGEVIVTKKYMKFACGIFVGTSDNSSG